MDLRFLSLDRRLRKGVVRAADATGIKTAELAEDAFSRVSATAQPLFDWAHDSTLLSFEVDPISRSLRLGFAAAETPQMLSFCDGDYDAQHFLLREAARAAVRELRPRTVEPTELRYDERWEYCYQHNGDGWELGRTPPPLERRFAMAPLLPGQRALVVGCGRGHEAVSLARLTAADGANIVAIDIAPTAVRLTNEAAAAAGLSLRLRAYQADFLSTDNRAPLESQSYDLIVEHTCFCAIEVKRRGEYFASLTRLIKPGGRFLGLFYCHDYPGGPPFGSSQGEIRRGLQGFSIEHEEVPRDSVLSRAGVEWLVACRSLTA